MKKKDLTIIIILLLFAALIIGGSFAYKHLSSKTGKKDVDLSDKDKNIAIDFETEKETESAQENSNTEATGDYGDFTVYTEEGEAVKLSEKVAAGKPVIINFWTTWCGYCKMEMPDFNDCYNEYGDKIEFMMVDICGQGQDNREDAAAYVKEEAFDFPVYYDDDLAALQTYYTTGFPTTIIIDSNANVVYAQSGALTKDQLVSMIDQLI